MAAHGTRTGSMGQAGGEAITRVLPRKAFHVASIGAMAGVAAVLPRFVAVAVLALILLGFFLVFLGLGVRPRRERREFTGEFQRKDKAFPFQGTIMALVGGILALLLFGSTWAAAGLAVLALGDGLSTLYAVRLGVVKFPWADRYADAWTFGVLAGAAGAAVLVPWWMALAASALAQLPDATGVENTPVWMDDNLTTPLLAAAVIALLAAGTAIA